MIPTHRWFLALVSGLLPALSYLFGDKTLAYVMYATNVEIQITIVAHDADGQQRTLSPTALALRTTVNARRPLAGADRFRAGPHNPALVNHLPEVGELACAVAGGTVRFVDVTLTERRRHHTTESRRHVQVPCSP